MDLKDHDLITVTAAATRLGVTELTVRRWIATGRLGAVRIGPKLLRVDVAEVEALATAI